MSTATSINSRRKKGAGLILALCLSAPLSAQAPARIDLGLVRDSHPVSSTFTLRNPSADRIARVDLISGCACLSASPDRLMLAPGESARVRVTYDPQGDRPSGEIKRSLVVKSSLRELDSGRILVTGKTPAGGVSAADLSGCDECRRLEEQFSDDNFVLDYAANTILLDFYGDPGCAQCEEYLTVELPRAQSTSARKVRVARHSILDRGEIEQLQQRLAREGASLKELPVAFIGAEPKQGLPAIRAAVARALKP